MAISVTCACGKICRAKEEAAGKKVRCPQCGNLLAVPLHDAEQDALDALMTAPGSEPDDYEPAVAATAPPPPPPPAAPPRMMPQPASSRSAGWGAASAQEFAQPKPQRGRRIVFEEGWFGSINSGVIGGVLMIVIAAVWFGLGLMADRIFIYPPILGVIGLMSIFKGMAGGGD